MGQRIGTITWQGLTFGPGTRYPVTSLAGLDDLPEVRTNDLPRSFQHGDFTGADYTASRTVQLGLGLRGDIPDDLRPLTAALIAATQPQTSPAELVFVDWGLMLRAKVRRRAIPYDAQNLWTSADAVIEFYCADPRIYSADEHTVATSAYSPSAGRSYPLTYPRAYGLAGQSGRITLANAGGSDAWPRLRIIGPVSTPSVEWTTGGLTLQLDVDLQAGETVDIDTRTRAVLYQGSTPRPDWVRRGPGFGWPRVAPGTNEVVYRGASLTGSPAGMETTLIITWRDTTL